MIRKRVLFILLFCATLCGCAIGAEDPENRRLITTLGFDCASEGQIRVTLRFEPLTPGLQSGMVTAKDEKNGFIVQSSIAKGITQALEQMQLCDEQSHFIGQCKTIVLGEELCRNGIFHQLMPLTRPPLLPPTAFIVNAKGDAKKILDLQFEGSEATRIKILHYLSKQKIPFHLTRLWELYQAVLDPLKDPALPLSEPQNGKSLHLLGLALFKGDRKVGELSMDESILLAVAGNFLKTTTTLTLSMEKTKFATFQILGSGSRIEGDYRGNQPNFLFKIKLNLILREQSLYPLPLTSGELFQLTRKTKKILKHRFQYLFTKLQRLKTDPLALGERLRIQQTKHFRFNRWEREYPNASFKVDLRLKIVKTGVTK
jgi:Ger(x)C family germination protein